MPHFRPVVEFAVQLYRYVILDVPRPDAMAIDALDLASRIVVVTNQELSAVRSASRLASALRDRHGRDRVLVVVNRSDKQAEIGQADIEKVVAAKVKHMLPSDYRLALQALNQGRPLALDNHNRLAAGFRGLAKELAKIETEPKQTEPGPSLFGRLTGRS
jgi:pilus assembly protein CpaE